MRIVSFYHTMEQCDKTRKLQSSVLCLMVPVRVTGVSLTDCLFKGSNQTPLVFEILLRFRTYRVGLVADIEKAFHQISICKPDRDMLRFLWFKDTDEGLIQVVQYRFCRLPFGLKPSPALLNAVLEKHLAQYAESEPSVFRLLVHSFYVDDFIGGAASIQEGEEVYNKARRILEEGGFNLRKWHTNVLSLQKQMTSDTKSSQDQVSTYVKVLGLDWDTEQDQLYFELSEVLSYLHKLPPTKRSFLKLSAKIFDPLGFLNPFTVQLKLIFQQLYVARVYWDVSNSKWWNGLSFLVDSPETRPDLPTLDTTEADEELVKSSPTIVRSSVAVPQAAVALSIAEVVDVTRFSNLKKLLRVTARVLKFVQLCRRKANAVTKELTARDINRAEELWVKAVQGKSFATEIESLRKSRPQTHLQKQLNVFFDDKGLIRCQGCINNADLSSDSKTPILLPSRHEFTILLIRRAHNQVFHDGIREIVQNILIHHSK